MSPELKAEVVKLLRQTAEGGPKSGIGSEFAKLYGVDTNKEWQYRWRYPVWETACKAREDVHEAWLKYQDVWLPYEEACLIAAQLIEAGIWPEHFPGTARQGPLVV